MKKTTLALAVAIASITSVANAALPENTWYVGGKLGWSKFYKTESDKVEGADKVSASRVGGGAFVGFQANRYLAAELGYDWLGKAEYKTNGSSPTGKLTVHGASLTGKVSYPISFISDDLDIYARAGAFIHTTKWKSGGSHSTDTSVSPVYALGFDYRLNEDFSTRLEYQWVNKIGNDGPTDPSNGLLTLGVTYALGSPNVAKASELVLRENRFVLNEDVLFTYAKAELKPEGKAALDNLVSTLIKLNPSESAIVVIGHTDRIGSSSYNLKLSEKRADAVMNYLVSQGVPANLISARGVGKSQPLTGDQCNALKGAELITCLAPDRRVEIEVKAVSVQEFEVTEHKDNTK
ncbi:OOP family OmpA-OmpF porin [Orbus hercynius]|uniref:OOP family OmpA-OmpF porin n=1 Tax=Orbus hercynius TaxID=593135 RepID=A0A495RFK3_9GAMM|nr:porin OmpA [Orbus hercynius]RKS86034.1 OOP family OmpA-OmpF porin [Orbus hercynius]